MSINAILFPLVIRAKVECLLLLFQRFPNLIKPSTHPVSNHVIISSCSADIDFAISLFKHFYGFSTLYSTDKRLIPLLKQKIDSCHPEITTPILYLSPWNLASLIIHAKNIYLFSFGTFLNCLIAKASISIGKPFFYYDCYFGGVKKYENNLTPAWHNLGSVAKSRGLSNLHWMKQTLLQFLIDPLRRIYYFTSCNHTFLTDRFLTRVRDMTSLVDELMHKYPRPSCFKLPEKSLVFCFSSIDNNWSPDWDLFFNSGYNLYFKPHPFTNSDYSNYPPSLLPIAEGFRVEDLEIPDNTFIISVTSYALSCSSNSISLLHFRYKDHQLDPQIIQYANKAKHLPRTSRELKSILALE